MSGIEKNGKRLHWVFMETPLMGEAPILKCQVNLDIGPMTITAEGGKEYSFYMLHPDLGIRPLIEVGLKGCNDYWKFSPDEEALSRLTFDWRWKWGRDQQAYSDNLKVLHAWALEEILKVERAGGFV